MERAWTYRPPIINELENIRRQVGQIIADAFEGIREDNIHTTFPFMDVLEKDGELLITAELPGLNQSQVNIDFEDDILTISGEIAKGAEFENAQPIRSERFYGKFRRRVRANYRVDVERIAAIMKDGVLRIHLPKHQDVKGKTVKINIQ